MCYTTTASQTDGDEARTLRPLQVTAITYRIAPGRAQGTMY